MLALSRASFGLEFEILGGGEAKAPFELSGAVAVVRITGPLLQHASWCWDSYDAIRGRVGAALACAEATSVLLVIDSPGGDAGGCFALARDLRAMAAEAGKALVAYCYMAGSAAYAIASGCSRILASETSGLGSIGVYEVRVDVTALDAAMGVKYEFFASGPRKLDGNEHTALKDDARAAIAARVDVLAGLFFDLVAEHRGLDRAQVEALGGELVLGGAALRAGLIDELRSYGDALASLQSEEPSPMKITLPQAKAILAAYTAQGAQAKATDKEWEALKTLAESEDEENKKAAGKMLKRMMGSAEEGGESEDEKKKKDDEAKAKAEADEKKKKDDDEAKAKAEGEKKESDEKAQALAASSLAMAQELQTLKAKDAARDAAEAKAKDDGARAKLLAGRPDFSPEQLATLALVPIAEVAKACEKWPRIVAMPGSSAAALTAGGGQPGGEKKSEYAPVLTADQSAILAKLDGPKAGPKAGYMNGTLFVMPVLTQTEAAARLAELEKEAV